MFKNILLADLLGSQHLGEVLQTSLTFENSENVVKSGSFEICLRWRAPFFFRKKGGIESLLCKNINVLLYYEKVGFYLKY